MPRQWFWYIRRSRTHLRLVYTYQYLRSFRLLFASVSGSLFLLILHKNYSGHYDLFCTAVPSLGFVRLFLVCYFQPVVILARRRSAPRYALGVEQQLQVCCFPHIAFSYGSICSTKRQIDDNASTYQPTPIQVKLITPHRYLSFWRTAVSTRSHMLLLPRL